MLFSRLLPSVALFLSATATVRKGSTAVSKEVIEQSYFHRAAFSPHYDPRFATAQLNKDAERRALKKLIKSYFKACRDLRVDTWLAHSTLLGWWWNKQVLPWDSTVAVQVFDIDMEFLARNHNMSVTHLRKGPNYLLDVNSQSVGQGAAEGLDVTDARWIDMESGLFINIMAARYRTDLPGEEMLSFRDGYKIKDSAIIPLRKTHFEGTEVTIPYLYREVLREEYGEQALSETKTDRYRFDVNAMRWELK